MLKKQARKKICKPALFHKSMINFSFTSRKTSLSSHFRKKEILGNHISTTQVTIAWRPNNSEWQSRKQRRTYKESLKTRIKSSLVKFVKSTRTCRVQWMCTFALLESYIWQMSSTSKLFKNDRIYRLRSQIDSYILWVNKYICW